MAAVMKSVITRKPDVLQRGTNADIEPRNFSNVECLLNGMERAALDPKRSRLQELESFTQNQKLEWSSPEFGFLDSSANWLQEKVVSGIVRMQTHFIMARCNLLDSKLKLKSIRRPSSFALKRSHSWKQDRMNAERIALVKNADPLATSGKLKHPSALVELDPFALIKVPVEDTRKGNCEAQRKLEQQIEQKQLNIDKVSSTRRLTQKGNIFKQLFCGGFAGVVSRTAVAPLDLVKIKKHPGRFLQLLSFHTSLSILFYGQKRGNGVNCVRVAPCKAIELCVFEIVKRLLNKDGNPLQNVAAPVAGGAAGMAGTLATYPLEVLRTRMAIQPEHYNGMISAVTKVLREEGFGAFYSGLVPSLVGVFPYSATNYFVYDGLRSTYRRATGNQSIPTVVTLLFGAVAAAASSTVTFPLEVARKQLQLGTKGLVTHRSAVSVIREIYSKEGFWALYRGLGTTWLKLVPAAGIAFVCYEAARIALEVDDAFQGKSRTSRLAQKK
ncbi:hypothetical protein O6H91_20G016400 [Diphasiastrum complanatum]|uniref:Uncharacterized protein n=1 Tax=Diphasiastrum complanatum TaxID=34168 RepID=A0ACC2AN00_DIPCM|nr:hypothetical protein O6H91_20G016400 [Diphasiastrum complanatum]